VCVLALCAVNKQQLRTKNASNGNGVQEGCESDESFEDRRKSVLLEAK
jgi:hypothetical protein